MVFLLEGLIGMNASDLIHLWREMSSIAPRELIARVTSREALSLECRCVWFVAGFRLLSAPSRGGDHLPSSSFEPAPPSVTVDELQGGFAVVHDTTAGNLDLLVENGTS